MNEDRILRLPAVLDATGLSRSRLYDLMAKGRFPQSVRIGERSVGWRNSDVQDWIKSRALNSNATSTDKGDFESMKDDIEQAMTSSDYSWARTSRDNSHAITAGNYARGATHGNGAHAMTAGSMSPALTEGKKSHAVTVGQGSIAVTHGERSHAIAAGDGANVLITGKNSIAISIGHGGKAKASNGGAIVLAYWENGKLIHIRASKVGKNGIKPDVWYILDEEGNFIEDEN